MQSGESKESTMWQDNYQSLTISLGECLGMNY